MQRTPKMYIFVIHPVTKCQTSLVVRHLFSFNPSVYFAWFQVSASLKLGPIGCPETSVRNCRYPLLNSPKERSSHLRTLPDTIPCKTKRYCSIWLSTYRAVNTLHLRYSNQPVKAEYGKCRCLFRVPHKTHKYTVKTT